MTINIMACAAGNAGDCKHGENGAAFSNLQQQLGGGEEGAMKLPGI